MAKAPTLQKERTFWRLGVRVVAGVDEAGRGALAGPVVVGAVVLPHTLTRVPVALRAVRDSKQLTPASRERLYDIVTASALAWAVGEATHEEVDALDVLGATLLAMRRALAALNIAPGHVLIDGRFPKKRLGEALGGQARTCIVRGDATVLSIAASSILAKVTRDRVMRALGTAYPAYGFGVHKGYGTEMHRAALLAHGPCPIHRTTFLQ